jgi:hypothetical protein
MPWGVFVWDADGDMGDAVVLGPFTSSSSADRKADSLREDSDRFNPEVNVMVVPLLAARTNYQKTSMIVRGKQRT